LLVAVLRQGKRKVFAINPMAAARYRDRHSVSRKKSDPGDALVLANILRTDMHAHRTLPDDSDLARAIAVLARAQQDATWNRQQISNQLRSLLREYYPSALAAFESWRNGLCRPEAHEILKLAPTPARAARLTRTQLHAALKRAGRQRGIEAEAERLRAGFRSDYAHQPALVEDALGKQMLALLVQLQAACTAADDLAQAVEEAFPQHPDAEIILSFPGLGVQLGARVLAEIADDRTRFRRCPRSEDLRRRLTHRPGLRQEVQHHPPPGRERQAQHHRLPLGLLRTPRLARSHGPLSPPP
jgi:hypothetical protein